MDLNGADIDDLAKALKELPDLRDAHYIDIVIRRNGEDEVYPGDWIRQLKRKCVG